MKRTFALTGFTMLGTLLVFCNIDSEEAVSVAVLASLAVLLLSVVLFCVKKNKSFVAFALSVCISLCALQLCNSIYNNNKMLYCDRDVSITASLNSLPYSENGKHYYPVVTSVVDAENKKLSIRLVSSSPLDLEPTDEISIKVKLYLLGKNDESYENYYRSKNVIYGGYVQRGSIAEVNKNADYSPMQLVLLVRNGMCQSIMYVLPNDYGAVLCSILLGEKSFLSQKTENAFRICGVSHLFAVSGLHLTVWSMLVFSFLKRINLSGKKAAVLSIGFCIFFMMLTGLNPPVIRAGFMMIAMYASDLFSRESDAFNSIGLALSIMLLFNPYSALSISLWLSLLATSGILITGTQATETLCLIIEKIFKKRIEESDRLQYSVLSLIAISISVSVFTLPVYIFEFNNISALTVISNLIMVSVGTLCMELAGAASVLIMLHLGFLGKPVMILAGLLSKYLTETALSLSRFRYALIPVNSIPSKICFAITVVTVLVILLFKIKNKKAVNICVLILTVAFVTANTATFIYNFNSLKITVNQVKNGTSVVMKYKGKCISFCSGLGNFEQYKLSRSITDSAVAKVDCLILPDCAGLDEASLNTVIKSLNVDNLIVPKRCSASDFNIKCNVGFIDNSVIKVIPEEFTVYLNEFTAKAVFFDTDIVISFRDDIILSESESDIIILAGKMPEDFNEQSYRLCIAGSKNSDRESSALYTDELGNIELTVGKKQRITYRRAADA